MKMKKAVITLLILCTAMLLQFQVANAQELVGTWEFSGGSIEFNGDGSGVMLFKNKNRNAPCPEGSVTKFNWEANEGRLHLDYQSMYICGEKQSTPDSDAPQQYTIRGNTLNWAGVEWQRVY